MWGCILTMTPFRVTKEILFCEGKEKIMRNLITLTHILSLLFLGLIVGGIIAGNSAAWGWGIALLVIDVIAGIVLQYYEENKW